MGLRDLVAQLANAVAKARAPLHHRHALLVHILRSAPIYGEAGRLDAWEAAYIHAEGEVGSSPVDGLLSAVFELGRFNLYTQFDAQGTQEQFAEVKRQFAAEGVPTPDAGDLTTW